MGALRVRLRAARARARAAWRRVGLRAVLQGCAFATLALVLGLVAAAALTPLPEELRRPTPSSSLVVTARDGALLREVRADDGARARWLSLADLGGYPVAAVLSTEDRRFYDHLGVDPRAVLRAALGNLWHRRVTSGASTVTMQLARTLRPHPKTLVGKLSEMALALRIEASVPKDRILEEYLNRVSFGPGLRGFGAASRAYFGKAPRELSLAEAALLAGVIRGPSAYAPDRHPERAKARRGSVLRRMVEASVIDEARRSVAAGEPLSTLASTPAFGAPHLVSALVSGAARPLQPGLAWPARPARIETTLDAALQREAETAVRASLARLVDRHVTAASVIVLEQATGDVLAWVGSPDVFDAQRLGGNDGVLARRQPGSTLKPFLYALAMETRGFTASTVLPDVELVVPTASGQWTPRNYDERFHGPVRLREALGNSLNVPAVWTALQVGVEPFLARLRGLGLDTLTEAAPYYGPALALGDGEVRLVSLANAYATLARGGMHRPLRLVRAVTSADGVVSAFAPGGEVRVMPEEPARAIAEVLSDRRARLASFGDVSPLEFAYDVAAKTGTSKGFRDNWAVGFSSEVVVGVWVGNFDGSPMQDVSGVAGAAPIFHAVMDAAMRARTPRALGPAVEDAVEVSVCPLSGARATHACPRSLREKTPRVAADALPACPFHVMLAVDPRNGLRAGPGCEATVSRAFESLPPEYDAWSAAEGRPSVPQSSPLCPATESVVEGALAIHRPLGGTIFVVDPDRPLVSQRVEVHVRAPASVANVTLRVDGERFQTRARPFVFEWPLRPGAHAFVAQADGAGDSAVVRVLVRE